MSTAAQLGQLATLLIIALITAFLLMRTIERLIAAARRTWERRHESPLERYRRTQEP